MREYHVRFCEGLVVKFRWSTHLSDALADGRRLRLLNVIDDFNREALAMDVALSIPSEQVIRYLERTIEQRGKPKEIRVDNGLEYISERLISWTESQGILYDPHF